MKKAMLSGLAGLVPWVLGSVASANPYREPLTAMPRELCIESVPKAPHP
jgi:hypothetical protein